MIILMLIVKHTQSMRTVDFGFDYIIILYGAMFEFAHVTESGILCWNVQFTFCVVCPMALYEDARWCANRRITVSET